MTLDDDIIFYLDGAIGLTLVIVVVTLTALAIVMYLEQRAQVCHEETFVLRLYSSEIGRLWREVWHAILCI